MFYYDIFQQLNYIFRQIWENNNLMALYIDILILEKDF